MVYTTKFFKIGMFKLFKLSGTLYQRTGRKYYKNVTAGTTHIIASLGTDVVQVDNQYAWTT